MYQGDQENIYRGFSVIQVTNLSHTYPNGVQALAATSLTFRAGEFTVLLGPSGAGKSTLLRCLNLLNIPTTGRIRVQGLGELKSFRLIREHRLRTGMIFQQHQLIGRYAALDNVLAGRFGYYRAWRSLLPLGRADKNLALDCLRQVGLGHKALERVDRLSGGEQQRVGIARALAQEPMLILADEPVASLDPSTGSHVLTLLRSICKKKHITAIVSLHQVNLAKQFADRIVGLASGRVLFDGTVDNLTAHELERIYVRGPGSLRRTHSAAVGRSDKPARRFSPVHQQ